MTLWLAQAFVRLLFAIAFTAIFAGLLLALAVAVTLREDRARGRGRDTQSRTGEEKR